MQYECTCCLLAAWCQCPCCDAERTGRNDEDEPCDCSCCTESKLNQCTCRCCIQRINKETVTCPTHQYVMQCGCTCCLEFAWCECACCIAIRGGENIVEDDCSCNCCEQFRMKCQCKCCTERRTQVLTQEEPSNVNHNDP